MTRIEVDREGRRGRIRPTVFGHFVEHMARCVYDGLVPPEGGPVRRSVLDLVRELRPSLIRYPGGCFAAEYHWLDGVGKERRRGVETFWSRVGLSRPEENSFGTDEFLEFCRNVGAEPYITVNMGTGTPQEAADWVAYTSGEVKLWSLGNEVFGPWETGHTGPAEYANRAIGFADAMLAKDSSISLVGVGADPHLFLGWNEVVLRRLGDRLEAISMHFYAPGPEAIRMGDTRDGYLCVVAASHALANSIDRVVETRKRAGVATPIALDEWAVWSGDDDLLGAAETGESPALRDALFAATVFHRIFERPETVTIACYAQLVNVLGLIQTEEDRAFVTPPYHVFSLYGVVAGGEALSVKLTGSPTFEAPEVGKMPRMFDVPFVDAAAASSPEGVSYLFLVNVHPSQDLEVFVAGEAGRFRALRLEGDGPFARNSVNRPDHVTLHDLEVELPRLTLPAHSVTRIAIG